MQTIPLAKICPIKTNFEQLISDEHPHSYILTPYFGIGIMRNLQMAMQLCISILFIDKWLCNFTFRFCSSTNGYATLHFDFVHQQNGYATLHFGFVHQQNGYATLHFDFVHRQMAMQLYISILFIDKMVKQLCNSTLSASMYNFHMENGHVGEQNGISTWKMDHVDEQNGISTWKMDHVDGQNGISTWKMGYVDEQNGISTWKMGYVDEQIRISTWKCALQILRVTVINCNRYFSLNSA